mgnify:CR=1 FL=1
MIQNCGSEREGMGKRLRRDVEEEEEDDYMGQGGEDYTETAND